ncbi:MAG: hypothetical protein KDA42_14755 [Planctomycetales bacterium]|nr:hypothetical protein [Planctomycetales bacterium]
MDLKSGILIGLSISVLLSLVAAYLSSKTWQIAHVIVVFFIFVASGAYWYLAGVTVKIHNFHRTRINQLREQVAMTERQIEAMKTGINEATMSETDETVIAALEQEGIRVLNSSIRETETQIYRFTLDRGRFWPEAELDAVNADGSATLTITSPLPHGIRAEDEVVVFAFESGETAEGARYMSGFKVTGVDEDRITLTPLAQLSPRRLEQVTASRGNWDLYEVMPVDRHDVFAGLDEQDLAELIPPGSLPEYVKDGQIADPTDPPERVQGYKVGGVLAEPGEEERVVERRYVRQLRDYEYEYMYLAARSTLLKVDMERISTDSKRLQEGLTKTEANVAVRTTEKEKLTYDLQHFQQELQIVTDYLAALNRSHATLLNQIRTTYLNTRELAAKLAEVQLNAAEEIDRRTDLAPTASR